MSVTPWLLDRQLALSGTFSLAASLFAIFALGRKNVPSLLLLSGIFCVAYLLLVVH